ncbi:MAG: hypothetical protein LBK60_01470 [Verrucomicrobiales bacterium]|jgi:hypothetical protein|nr:hypothetical protein [Verrucomicrobiales bacterium]
MNLGQLTRALEIGVMRKDLAAEYQNYINTALREIQAQYTFTCMAHQENLTWRAGNVWVALPYDFKELQKGRGQIEVCGRPVDVTNRAMLKRLGLRYGRWRTPGLTRAPAFACWLEFQNGEPVVRTQHPMGEDAPVTVFYYRYLPPLAKATDENALTREFPLLVLNRAKAGLFALINDDERAGVALQLFEKDFRHAQHTDELRRIGGVRTQT